MARHRFPWSRFFSAVCLICTATYFSYSDTGFSGGTASVVIPRPAAVRSSRKTVTYPNAPLFWFIWSVSNLDTWHWMPLACIESVLTFHPTAHVVILSNSMPTDFFSCFADLGFDVTVQRYDLPKLVEGTFLEEFVTRGLWAESVNSTFRYAHE